ncbi:MAG: TIGR04013 family B12-binding domain/radical SAM domain-containing protein [Candidatus Thorarchaeota archaeon]
MQKNIAFVVYYHKNNKYSFNALIGALESYENIHEIDIFFIKTKENLIAIFRDLIRKYDIVILGVSFFTTQLWEINGLINTLIKKYSKNLIYLAGGPHPTGDPLGTLKIGFDVVFIGEGEETLIDFFQKIRNNEDYKDIKGIAYMNDDNEISYTGKRAPINLDKYSPFPIQHNKFGPIEITRGCPYFCYFCQTPYILGGYPRHRNIDSISKYVRIMKSKNLTDIRFITPNAFSYGSLDGKTINLPKLKELVVKIYEIIPKGRIFLGSFPSEVRPEHVSEETLNLVKNYASNDNIIIGAQSGSQRVLDLCHRSHTVEDIYNAVELTLKSGLQPNVDFIFGLPNENVEDIKLTINMMNELSKKGARIHTHSFIPLPQTPFGKEPADRIDTELQKTIKRMTSRGIAFGDWKEQEWIALKIAKYFKTKTIK